MLRASDQFILSTVIIVSVFAMVAFSTRRPASVDYAKANLRFFHGHNDHD